MRYPITKKVDQIDDFHGTPVADPYRWLESTEGEEISSWIDQQNELVDSYIDHGVRKSYKKRLTELMDYTRYTVPIVRGNRYYYTKNDGLQPQAVQYFKDGRNGDEQFLFDPNSLSDDGTVAVVQRFITEDGKYIAMAISTHGSDWMDLKVFDVEKRVFLNDTIQNCRNGAGVQWLDDNSGFYYSAYIGKEEKVGANKLWFHRIGDDQINDKLILEHPDDEELHVFTQLFQNNKWQFVSFWNSTMPQNLLWYKRLEEDEWIKLVDKMEYSYSVLAVINDIVYLRTNENADNGKIIAIDLKNSSKENWKEIITEREHVIPSIYQGGVTICADHIFVSYLKDVKSDIEVFDLDGNFIKNIELPAIGSGYVFGRQAQNDAFITFTSFFYPAVILSYIVDEGRLITFFENKLPIDGNRFEVKQVFYNSKDGTNVPMFIVHKKGLILDGNTPTLLYGYGGFNISNSPGYSTIAISFIEKGGIYASACIRGGGEYGKKWHFSGILEKKQNVFDDFIAAAEWLISKDYTNNKKLAIYGGSNGGLLTASCGLQRPDLYGAVVTAVGVLDMLRFHKYSIGRFWVPEYGNPEDPEHFNFLIKYSPLHNVEEREYPPMLVHTADTDDRVDPAHSKKFAATLQEKGKGGPLLLRIVKKAGHGMGKPISKVIEDMSYNLAFIDKSLNSN